MAFVVISLIGFGAFSTMAARRAPAPAQIGIVQAVSVKQVQPSSASGDLSRVNGIAFDRLSEITGPDFDSDPAKTFPATAEAPPTLQASLLRLGNAAMRLGVELSFR
ncbi:MAG: hypothetical protein ACRD30_03750 [Bryobacteraceae bacterium]